LACESDFGLCQGEKHTNGYTHWASESIRIMTESNEFVAPVQGFLAMLTLAVTSVMYGLEQAISAAASPSFAATSVAAVVGYTVYNKQTVKA